MGVCRKRRCCKFLDVFWMRVCELQKYDEDIEIERMRSR